MSKASLVSLLVATLTLGGAVFASVRLSSLRDSLSGLEDRVSRIEAEPHAGRPEAGVAPAEVAKLRAELDRLIKAQRETVVIPGSDGHGGLTVDDLNRALDEANKIKDQETRRRFALEMSGRIEAHNQKFQSALTGKLKLTPEKGVEIKTILQEQMKSYRELMEAGVASDEFGSKIKEINDDVDKKIRALLTPEQLKPYDDIPPSTKWFGSTGPRKTGGGPR